MNVDIDFAGSWGRTAAAPWEAKGPKAFKWDDWSRADVNLLGNPGFETQEEYGLPNLPANFTGEFTMSGFWAWTPIAGRHSTAYIRTIHVFFMFLAHSFLRATAIGCARC